MKIEAARIWEMGGNWVRFFEIQMDDEGEIEAVFGDSDGYDVAEGMWKMKFS